MKPAIPDPIYMKACEEIDAFLPGSPSIRPFLVGDVWFQHGGTLTENEQGTTGFVTQIPTKEMLHHD